MSGFVCESLRLIAVSCCWWRCLRWGRSKRLWVLRAPGEMVEYDPATFAVKQRVKSASRGGEISRKYFSESTGQILFASAVDDSRSYRGGCSRAAHVLVLERARGNTIDPGV